MYWWFSFPFSTFYGQFYQGLLVRIRRLPTVVPEKQNTVQRTFSDLSSVAKGSRHESLKRAWELGKCHTHIQPHTHTAELMEFAFWQLSSWGTATTKITFHLVFLFLSNYASGEKELAETECSLEGRGEFKYRSKFICYTTWYLSGGFDLGQEVWLVPGGNLDRFDHSNLYLLCFYIWYLLLVAISGRKVCCGASSGLFVYFSPGMTDRLTTAYRQV